VEMRPTSTKDTERFNGVNFSVMRMPQLSNSNKEVSPRLKKKKMLVLQGPDSGIYASLQQGRITRTARFLVCQKIEERVRIAE